MDAKSRGRMLHSLVLVVFYRRISHKVRDGVISMHNGPERRNHVGCYEHTGNH